MIRSHFLFVLTLLIAASCSTTRQINNGRTAYQQKQYAIAVDLLNQEIIGLDSGIEYAEMAFMLGMSFKNLNKSDDALKWFIESAKNDYGIDAYWEMAYALKKKERYDDAILSFQRLQKLTDRNDIIDKEIEKCRMAIQLSATSHPGELAITPMPLNSEASDYSPQLYKNQSIVFTSDRNGSTGNLTYNWTGNSFSDIYAADIDGRDVRPFDDFISTIHNEGTASFNIDGTEMYYTFCHADIGDSYCKIMRRKLDGNLWSVAEPAFQMKSKVNYGDPVLIENGSVLIYVSDDPTGIGAHDLYYSVREDDDTWSAPELMPSYLNTIGEERFPTWDGSRLYYSSDNFAGLGGLDIFSTALNDDGTWTTPSNMLKPINSSEDDYGLIFLPEEMLSKHIKQSGFFTSTRGVYGSDDIFSFTEFFPDSITRDDLLTVDTTVAKPVQDQKTYYLMVKVIEKLYANAENPNSFVVGSRPVAEASLKMNGTLGSDIKSSDPKGLLVVPIDSIESGSIMIGKSGYLNQLIDIKINTKLDDFPDRYVYEYEVTLDKIFEGVDIVLDDIFYDFNESVIREDAKPPLDKLTKMLVENPAIKIELSSHTDCRGEEDYNLRLSEERAAAAIAYISSQNTSLKNRLSSKGYGESSPEITCECQKCSEDEHQINRRTTFRILK